MSVLKILSYIWLGLIESVKGLNYLGSIISFEPKSRFHLDKNFNMKSTYVFVYGLLLSLFLSACAKNPVTGKRELVFISEKREIAMGKEYDPQIVGMFGLYEDPKIQAFIDEKGQEMAKVSHRPHLNYEFKILDSPVVNAFAVPGGYVYFTRGIMAHFSNEAEFAGVLGHEIGHITARHTVRQQRNQLLAQLGLIAGIIAVPEVAQFAEPASQGIGLLLLSFGRNAERESDELGVRYSTKVGYDAREMGKFFNTLQNLQTDSGAGSIPSFLSTHPDPGERFQTVTNLAEKKIKTMGIPEPKVNRNEYLSLIDGLIYGEDPKQGFVENDKFYHPDLAFVFVVPNGWKYQNSPSQFQMASEDGKGMVLLTLGQGDTPAAAANKAVEGYKLEETARTNVTINGLEAVRVEARQVSEQNVIRVLGYFIRHGDYVYNMLGVSTNEDFERYRPTFESAITSFQRLTDQEKLNRQPERIIITQANRTGTLESFLRDNNIPQNRLNELATLNGMKLSDTVAQGDRLKLVGRRQSGSMK